MKATEIQIVNAPPIDGEDPIMAAKKFQGDIIVPNPSVLLALNSASSSPHPNNAIIDDQSKWPNAVIPYAISSEYETNERAVIAKAMGAFHAHTCIRFTPHNNEEDYIFIKKGNGCSSAVGRVQGRQTVSLGNGCVYYGIVIHELMHAAGFWHEQSRQDRDNHVTIIWNNIQKGMDYNFHKYGWDIIQDLGVSYDTESIMHYGGFSFAIDRSKPTIIANNGDEIGQRLYLSKVRKNSILCIMQTDTNISPVVITTPTNAECKDDDQFCAQWSRAGECKKNPAWMHNNCKKSCKTCSKDCKNDNSECDAWAKDGHCSISSSFMVKHCKLACGICGGGVKPPIKCKDENEYCQAWSKTGECRTNPNYMHKFCKKSCKKC
ncbi:UNVERIFIED_CONTAM: hypothetical protein GTU68_042111 [Idotea baltica]|nr:hypothetical protein [Idotea baltica]